MLVRSRRFTEATLSARLAPWASLAVLVCPAAFGETPEAAAPEAQLEEVVVTSQRREERLQTVPISVTALNTAQLESNQITDVLALAQVTPALMVKQTFDPTEILIGIRGVSSNTPALSNDPTIGIYVDGVYNVLNAGANNAMIDVARVEVLKGPQGTLFGRNTIGGAINITTNKPTGEVEGSLQVDAGNYGARTYTGIFNTPVLPGVVDTRWVYQYTKHDGYGTNLELGTPLGTLDQHYVRGSVRIVPTDAWEVLLSGFWTESSGQANAIKAAYVNPNFTFGPGIPPVNALVPALSGHPGDLLSNYVGRGGFFDDWSDIASPFGLRQYGATGTVSVTVGTATIKSITGWSQTEHRSAYDLDGTPYVVIDVPAWNSNARQFSEELQAYGNALDDRLEWITGLYYSAVKGNQPILLNAVPALSPPPTLLTYEGPEVDNSSSGAFAQLTYKLAQNLRLTGGVRYTEDSRESIYRDHAQVLSSGAFAFCELANAPSDPNSADCTFSKSLSDHSVPWTVSIDYTPLTDTLLYAKVSQGYRSGATYLNGPAQNVSAAANAAAIAAFTGAEPESLLSPELGAKVEFLDHRLRVNSAIYYSDYKNLQASVTVPNPVPGGTPITTLRNSGDGRVYGGELEITALLGRLRLDAGLGVAKTKYNTGQWAGSPFADISTTNYSLAASYPIATRLGELTLHANYGWRSSFALGLPSAPGEPAEEVAALTQRAYGLLNARIDFELANAPISLSFYGQNLTNKQYTVSGADLGPLGYVQNTVGNPRTIGGSIKYSF